MKPRWWWSRDRKQIWRLEQARIRQRQLWEATDHGRRTIHLVTLVNSRKGRS